MDSNTTPVTPVITLPEDLPPGTFIPYEKQDRTPAALQHLEALAAEALGIDRQRLVSLRGAVVGEGSVAMFVEMDERMSTVAVGYVVASYRGGDTEDGRIKPTVSRYAGIARANEAYDRRKDELS